MAKLTGFVYGLTRKSKPLEDVTIVLYNVDKKEVVETATTTENGDYSFDDVAAGDYEVIVADQLKGWSLFRPGGAQKINVGSEDAVVPPFFFRPASAGRPAPPPPAADAEDGVGDLHIYPLLTRETDGVTSSTVRAGESGSLKDTVDNTLRQVLGWRPRTTDTKGFLAALDKSFRMVKTGEQEAWEWHLPSYTVRADLGAVSGAQASFDARAKATIIEQALPLLDRLTPLRSDADDEDIEATRYIVRLKLEHVANAMSLAGGPIVQRVDTLFAELLGTDPVTFADDAGGLLGVLRERFGLDRARVNTIEEEENYTNFLIIVDYVLALQKSWNAQRAFFDRRGGDVFLGTHLVYVSRALGVMVEDVEEVQEVMDSVFLGQAERESIQLELEGPSGPTITIAELLSWVEEFASEEAPAYIREGGKDGIIAMEPSLETLQRLTFRAWQLSRSGAAPVPGFSSKRVQRPLKDLYDHTYGTLKLVNDIIASERPLIHSVELTDDQPEVVAAVIDGDNFQDGAQVRLTQTGNLGDQDFAPTETIVDRPTRLLARFSIDPLDFLYATYDLVVTNPDGQRARLDNAVSVSVYTYALRP